MVSPIRTDAPQLRTGAATPHVMARIWELLDSPDTTDVLINPDGAVWVDSAQGLQQMLWRVPDTRQLAMRLSAQSQQRLDEAMPIVDGRLPQGIRLHAVLDPISVGGASISLRRPQPRVLSMEELITSGMCSAPIADYLQELVAHRANVLISGATGSGKSTLMAAMLSQAPASQRIICVEEAHELTFNHPHTVHLQCRNANVQGSGALGMQELVRAAMRMRPDRLVIGESRGAEIQEMLMALNTGHAGSWTTLHANAARDVPARLIALGALAQMSAHMVQIQAYSALNAVVHVAKVGPVRFVQEIGELKLEPFRVETIMRAPTDLPRNRS